MKEKRGASARTGVTLLNLLTPGLGLLRLGKWKAAAAIFAAALLFLIFMNTAPPFRFGVLASVAVIGLATYPASMVSTWILSRLIDRPRPWYTQWYVIVGALFLWFVVSYFLSDNQRFRYRSFYTPAEGMAPRCLWAIAFLHT